MKLVPDRKIAELESGALKSEADKVGAVEDKAIVIVSRSLH